MNQASFDLEFTVVSQALLLSLPSLVFVESADYELVGGGTAVNGY